MSDLVTLDNANTPKNCDKCHTYQIFCWTTVNFHLQTSDRIPRPSGTLHCPCYEHLQSHNDAALTINTHTHTYNTTHTPLLTDSSYSDPTAMLQIARCTHTLNAGRLKCYHRHNTDYFSFMCYFDTLQLTVSIICN